MGFEVHFTFTFLVMQKMELSFSICSVSRCCLVGFCGSLHHAANLIQYVYENVDFELSTQYHFDRLTMNFTFYLFNQIECVLFFFFSYIN